MLFLAWRTLVALVAKFTDRLTLLAIVKHGQYPAGRPSKLFPAGSLTETDQPMHGPRHLFLPAVFVLLPVAAEHRRERFMGFH